MIDVNEAIFPNNLVIQIAKAMDKIDADVEVYKRPLGNTDAEQSIGVSAQGYDPENESMEMMGAASSAPQMPPLHAYTLAVQAFIKDGDEERGLANHSTLAYLVRSVLYSDADLRQALQGLTAVMPDGRIERLHRWGIRTGRYFSGEIDSEMLYLCTFEVWAETQIS